MHNDESTVENSHNQASLRQLSLAEMFFITTLCAVSIGIYQYISPLFALACGGFIVVSAVVRFFGTDNVVLSGLIGFLASILVSYLVIKLGQTTETTSIGIAVICPAAGYVAGAFAAELRCEA